MVRRGKETFSLLTSKYLKLEPRPAFIQNFLP